MSDLNSNANRAVWFDIPVMDLDRAVKFYQNVLDIQVSLEQFDDVRFAVLEHSDGNGGCLVVQPDAITSNGGILVYLNVNGRIVDATAKVPQFGGEVLQEVHAIGPHGFRALIQDSEGNRLALHSESHK